MAKAPKRAVGRKATKVTTERKPKTAVTRKKKASSTLSRTRGRGRGRGQTPPPPPRSPVAEDPFPNGSSAHPSSDAVGTEADGGYCEEFRVRYYASVRVPVFDGSGGVATVGAWTARLGDVVAIAVTPGGNPTIAGRQRGGCGSFRPAQIVCLYEEGEPCNEGAEVYAEVRWMHRASDGIININNVQDLDALEGEEDDDEEEGEPSSGDVDIEEAFETDAVECVTARSIIGRVQLLCSGSSIPRSEAAFDAATILGKFRCSNLYCTDLNGLRRVQADGTVPSDAELSSTVDWVMSNHLGKENAGRLGKGRVAELRRAIRGLCYSKKGRGHDNLFKLACQTACSRALGGMEAREEDDEMDHACGETGKKFSNSDDEASSKFGYDPEAFASAEGSVIAETGKIGKREQKREGSTLLKNSMVKDKKGADITEKTKNSNKKRNISCRRKGEGDRGSSAVESASMASSGAMEKAEEQDSKSAKKGALKNSIKDTEGAVPVEVNLRKILHKEDLKKGKSKRLFFTSVTVSPSKESFAPNNKTRMRKKSTTRLGDGVCVKVETENLPGEATLKRHKHRKGGAKYWFPFTSPWRPAQLLTVYQDKHDEKGTASEVMVEVRWLYRHSDIKNINNPGLDNGPKSSCDGKEEVFETDDVEVIPATMLLGSPDADVFCRGHFYAHREGYFASIFRPTYLVKERGLELSMFVATIPELRRKVWAALQLSLSNPVLSRQQQMEDLPTASYRHVLYEDEGLTREYYDHVSLIIPWTEYEHANLLCHPKKRDPGWRWTVSVGDAVALRCDNSSAPPAMSKEANVWYPYKKECLWSPCRIAAIYRDTGGSTETEVKLEIRWLYRTTDIQTGSPTSINSQSANHFDLYETNQFEKESSLTSLLGPITIVNKDVMKLPGWMPRTNFHCDKQIVWNKVSSIKGLERSIGYSEHCPKKYRKVLKEAIVDAIKKRHALCQNEVISTKESWYSPMASLGTASADCNYIQSNPLTGTGGREERSDSNDGPKHEKREPKNVLVTTDLYPRNKWRPAIIRVGDDRLLISRIKTGSRQRSFYASADITLKYSPFAEGVAQQNFENTKQQMQWTISLGQAVCVKSDIANLPDEAVTWHPYAMPWKMAHVLAIYQDSKKGKVMAEVRWIYRRSDIADSTIPKLNYYTEAFNKEEVFETDHVDTIELMSFLGIVKLIDKKGQSFTNIESNNSQFRFPIVEFSCCHFYAHEEEQIMPIYEPSHLSVERSLKFSDLMNDTAKMKVWKALNLVSSPPKESVLSRTCRAPLITKRVKKPHREYYGHVLLELPWTEFQNAEILCHPRKREPGWRWKVRVGDTVAVRCNDSNAPIMKESTKERKANVWYPFKRNCKWSLCRINDMVNNGSELINGKQYCCQVMENIKLEISWLYRTSDIMDTSTDVLQPTEASSRFVLYDTNYLQDDLTAQSLLGPISIVPEQGEHDIPDSHLSEWLPIMYFHCNRQFDEGKIKHLKKKEGNALTQAFRQSKHYKSNKALQNSLLKMDGAVVEEASGEIYLPKEKQNATPLTPEDHIDNGGKSRLKRSHEDGGVPSLKRQKCTPSSTDLVDVVSSPSVCPALSAEKSVSGTNIKITAVGVPYHVDVSSSKSFYASLHVSPPNKIDNAPHEKKSLYTGQKWTVTLGDTVAVHIDENDRHRVYPFNVPWSPAEVVCIWKSNQSKEQSMREREDLLSGKVPIASDKENLVINSERAENFNIEIRWLYWKVDFLAKTKDCDRSGTNGWEEVLETDHMDVITADSLLSPVQLLSETLSAPSGSFHHSTLTKNESVMHFHCHRFWSVHQKSLVPTEAMTAPGRILRGRMLSNYFGKDSILKEAFNNVNSISIPQPPKLSLSLAQQMDQRKHFKDAISKLDLSNASADAQVGENELAGREKEQEKIKTFLRSAICGTRGGENNAQASSNSSIFIAGPPGTGKTACVRSVIAQLHREQICGDIPEFNFVSLNGMEMRYPYDAYVKFWEVVSEQNEKRSPGVAAAELERHFGGKTSMDGPNDSKRPVTVLLLDELDYLVTKKQTVLYNFFDWPRRGDESDNGPRLIVVGISNTINLPERLKPSVRSRLGGVSLLFKAYSTAETKNVIKKRLEPMSDDTKIFEDDALLFAAKRTAALSGDIRKAFQMCKAAAEAVLSELQFGMRYNSVIKVCDIQKASREMFNSHITKAVACATSFEALVLVSLASLKKQTGREQGGFDVQEIMTKIEGVALCDNKYLPSPSFGELLGILNRLGEARVIALHTTRGSNSRFSSPLGFGSGAWPLVQLLMEDFEVEAALRDTAHSVLAENFLAKSRMW